MVRVIFAKAETNGKPMDLSSWLKCNLHLHMTSVWTSEKLVMIRPDVSAWKKARQMKSSTFRAGTQLNCRRCFEALARRFATREWQLLSSLVSTVRMLLLALTVLATRLT